MEWWNKWVNGEYSSAPNVWTFDEQLKIGPFQGYALVISSAILVAIILSVISCRIRKIPVTEIILSLSILVPFSLMGASFFGKIGIKGYSHNIIDLIAFWEAGMAIHGGIIFAAIGATPLAYYVSRKYKISILAFLDAILPHILLAQAIGRWGNYFNHELMGPPMRAISSGDIDGLSTLLKNMVMMKGGQYYIMQPYFLYESIGLGLAWAVIIAAPYFVSIFSGPNKKYTEFFINIDDTFKSFFIWNKPWPHSYQGVWNTAFVDKINSEERIKYEENLSTYKTRWEKGKALYKANNPDNYIVLHSGVKTGMYLFLWNLVRVFLEVSKADDSLFIKYDKPASVVLISLTVLLGLAMALFCQFVTPYILRKPEYKYEKQYFYLSK